MAVLLAFGSAAVYGLGDFLGGLASRRHAVIPVIVVGHAIGLLTGLAFALAIGGDPTAGDLLWGAGSGVAGGAGIGCFYWALAHGAMSVVAPLTAVTNAVIPVGFGLITGERPGVLAYPGVLLAMVAIAMVSNEGDGDVAGQPRATPPAAIGAAVAGGVGFAVFFLLLSRAGDEAGLWPLVTVRMTSFALFFIVALGLRASLRPPDDARRATVGSGLTDQIANVLFLLASRQGLIIIVAAITTLYPAGTVLLAQRFLHERLRQVQKAGLALAAVAVVLIAVA